MRRDTKERDFKFLFLKNGLGSFRNVRKLGNVITNSNRNSLKNGDFMRKKLPTRKARKMDSFKILEKVKKNYVQVFYFDDISGSLIDFFPCNSENNRFMRQKPILWRF